MSVICSYAETGAPVKYISSCDIDLNNDGASDIALLIETIRGRELIVLIKTSNGYEPFLMSDIDNMNLSCHFGKTITETKAGIGKRSGKIHNTQGTYIKLTLPEGSSLVYFWNGVGFEKVWTSD